MPHLSVSFSQGAPTVDILVTASEPYLNALLAAGEPAPPPQSIRALIDTGASFTCLDPTVFTALRLQPTGNVSILTASTGSNPQSTDTYNIGIFIPYGPAHGLELPNIQAGACHLPVEHGYQGLLGRDILASCLLIYNGAQRTLTLSY